MASRAVVAPPRPRQEGSLAVRQRVLASLPLELPAAPHLGPRRLAARGRLGLDRRRPAYLANNKPAVLCLAAAARRLGERLDPSPRASRRLDPHPLGRCLRHRHLERRRAHQPLVGLELQQASRRVPLVGLGLRQVNLRVLLELRPPVSRAPLEGLAPRPRLRPLG